MLPRPMAQGADTIVGGAGAAGAVIAARVTERSDREVLLLEAGRDYPDASALPSDLLDGTRNAMKSHDWGFTHRVNEQQRLTFPLPRGRVVGGSSAVNTCIALRGVPSDYDEWAGLGLPEWAWERCLPAFKRLENDLDVVNEWHSQSGPIPLRRHPPEELVPWQRAFMEAAASLGFPRCDDHNDPRAKGYGPHAMNKINGQRMSAARCYLTPAVRARPNLTIRASAPVRRVLIEDGRAVGVEVDGAGGVEVIRAKAVVLSGGAIATPGILLRSGVGPRRVVESLGVALTRDLSAVGARLLDHPGAAFFLWPKRGVSHTTDPLIQTALRFRSEGSAHENDLQIQAGSFWAFPFAHIPGVSLMIQVGKPRGHGLIRWTSADPAVRPVITSRLLDDPMDRAKAVDALEVALRCADTPAMRALATPVFPPTRVLRARAALDAWVRTVCDSGYHPCGTVPMGASAVEGAVDAHGRVFGVEGLRVADASIMPTIPTCNTHLPTLMIGERMAEWIRDGD